MMMVLFQEAAQNWQEPKGQASTGCLGAGVCVRSILLRDPEIPREKGVQHARLFPSGRKEPAGRALCTQGGQARAEQAFLPPPPIISVLCSAPSPPTLPATALRCLGLFHSSVLEGIEKPPQCGRVSSRGGAGVGRLPTVELFLLLASRQSSLEQHARSSVDTGAPTASRGGSHGWPRREREGAESTILEPSPRDPTPDLSLGSVSHVKIPSGAARLGVHVSQALGHVRKIRQLRAGRISSLWKN